MGRAQGRPQEVLRVEMMAIKHRIQLLLPARQQNRACATLLPNNKIQAKSMMAEPIGSTVGAGLPEGREPAKQAAELPRLPPAMVWGSYGVWACP